MISTVHGLIAEPIPLHFTGFHGSPERQVSDWRRTCDSSIRVVEQFLFLSALLFCIFLGLF